MSRYVLLCEPAEDVASKAPARVPAERARWQAFHEAGTLLQIGTFADVQAHEWTEALQRDE